MKGDLAWDWLACDKLIRMLYLKAGGREVLEDLFVKVILWLRTILFWEGSQRIYSIVILHKFYFRMYWACFYSGWRLGNIFRLQDYCGSHEDADDDHLRMIIWVDYGYKINWLDFLWFNRGSNCRKIDSSIIKKITGSYFPISNRDFRLWQLNLVIERSFGRFSCINTMVFESLFHHILCFCLTLILSSVFSGNYVARAMVCQVRRPEEAGTKWRFEDLDPEVRQLHSHYGA